MSGLDAILTHGATYTTARLTVTPLAASDAELARLARPEVTAFLPDRLQVGPEGPADLNRWVEDLGRMGPLSGVRDGSTLVGIVILGRTNSEAPFPEVRLGYLFAEPFWGVGYASECVMGLIAHLSTRKISATLLAGVAVENRASAQVLRKAGFLQEPADMHAELLQFRRAV